MALVAVRIWATWWISGGQRPTGDPGELQRQKGAAERCTGPCGRGEVRLSVTRAGGRGAVDKEKEEDKEEEDKGGKGKDTDQTAGYLLLKP